MSARFSRQFRPLRNRYCALGVGPRAPGLPIPRAFRPRVPINPILPARRTGGRAGLFVCRNHRAGTGLCSAGRVSRTWWQREQGWFLRLPALANEKAVELLSHPARFELGLGSKWQRRCNPGEGTMPRWVDEGWVLVKDSVTGSQLRCFRPILVAGSPCAPTFPDPIPWLPTRSSSTKTWASGSSSLPGTERRL